MKNMPKMASAIALGFFIGMGYLSNVNAFSGSNVSEDEMGAQALANNPNLDPNFFVGNNFDYYPMLLNNVAGYDSLLVVTNMLDTAGFYDVCVIPAGSSSWQCTQNIRLAGRDSHFLYAGRGALGFLNNTTGQVFVFAEPNTLGASMGFIIDQGGNGVATVNPYQF